jgi:hypothetical protein
VLIIGLVADNPQDHDDEDLPPRLQHSLDDLGKASAILKRELDRTKTRIPRVLSLPAAHEVRSSDLKDAAIPGEEVCPSLARHEFTPHGLYEPVPPQKWEVRCMKRLHHLGCHGTGLPTAGNWWPSKNALEWN